MIHIIFFSGYCKGSTPSRMNIREYRIRQFHRLTDKASKTVRRKMEETDFVMIEDVHTRPAQRDDALSNVLHIFEPKIKLDVGGHIFATTIATLTRFPDSMLGTVFSGHALTTEEAGTFFFDRDGTLFRYILNYLRSPDSWDNSDFHGRQLTELMNEAEYYGLKDLMFPPTPPPPPFVPAEPVTVSSHDGSDITITKGDDQLWYMQNESIGSKVVKVCENCGLGWPTGCGHLHRVANFK